MDSISIFSIGDSAITLDLGNRIDRSANDRVLSIRNWFREHPITGIRDLVVGYSSLTIYYDPLAILKRSSNKTAYCFLKEKLQEALNQTQNFTTISGKLHRIPVCYEDEFAIDLEEMSVKKQLSKQEIIETHCSNRYRVFMIGFLPGFPYLGELPEKISMPRKHSPTMVKAGSVGIAGRQTGIYPLDSPGGWNIIGRTTLKMFDADATEPVWLEPGDEVEFYAISKEEFERSYEL